MAHAEKCLVCDGTGWYEPDRESDQECHGCDGLGWITVGVKIEKKGGCPNTTNQGTSSDPRQIYTSQTWQGTSMEVFDEYREAWKKLARM